MYTPQLHPYPVSMPTWLAMLMPSMTEAFAEHGRSRPFLPRLLIKTPCPELSRHSVPCTL